MQRIEFRAMGSQMMAAIDSDAEEALEAADSVPAMFEAWEQELSRFRDTSALNALNRSSGQSVQVGLVLWEVLKLSLEAAERSGGLVTPALLDVLEAAGYDRSFDAIQAGGSESPPRTRPTLAAPSPARDWREIEMDPATRTVRLPKGMRVDFGGIAKGWAADKVVSRLAAHGPALVDAGGDISVSGPMASGSGWPVGISDPLTPEQQLDLVMLKEGGVATSGRDYRRWRTDGKWQHHIIDPRTGHPAETDVLSATVVGPSTQEAEVAAKVALILGSRAGLEWLEARPEFAGLLVLEDGATLRSSRFDNYVWKQS